MTMKLSFIATLGIFICSSHFAHAGNIIDTANYKFTIIKTLKATPVKDQAKSGTCWCFSTISMFESELLRTGKGEYDLSEMYIVRHAYENKANRYVRMHGNIEFSEGGEPNDVCDIIKTYGIVPQSVYSGLKSKKDEIDHTQMDAALKSYVDSIIKPTVLPSPNEWMTNFDATLDAYLGKTTDKFSLQNQVYTPQSYANNLGINPDDYVLLTSFTHHPFYQKFILEIPDNWSWAEYYNVPLDDLMAVMDSSLINNFTFAWCADISEKGFSFRKGLAIVPDLDQKASSADWSKALSQPFTEKAITQSLRQEEFNNYSTTDDHGMHIIGIAKDQLGRKFYYVKNSWGTGNPYNGYLYASETYVKLKTISILVNKHAIPSAIRIKFKELL